MECKVCGYKGELRFGVCWYCAEAESIIADGTDMNDNGIGDRPARTSLEKVKLLLAHSWLHYGLVGQKEHTTFIQFGKSQLFPIPFFIWRAITRLKIFYWSGKTWLLRRLGIVYDFQRGLTQPAPDAWESADLEGESTPEVLSTSQTLSKPTKRG